MRRAQPRHAVPKVEDPPGLPRGRRFTRRGALLRGIKMAATTLPLYTVASGLAAGQLGAAPATTPGGRNLPPDAQIEAWARQMTAFGRDNPVFPGIRIAGTADEDAATQWIVSQLQSFGFSAWRESVDIVGWEPTTWALSTGTQHLPAYPLFYTPLAPGGISGPIVYVGSGSNLQQYDLRGKFALADQSVASYPYSVPIAQALQVWDPQHTINPLAWHPGCGPGNVGLVAQAAQQGAVGFIGIVKGKPEGVRCLPNAGDLANPAAGQLAALPGAYVDPTVGAQLKQVAQSGGTVTWQCAGSTPQTSGHNVVAQLPGQSSAAFQLSTHSDGGAVDEGSGVAAVLALASSYSLLPLSQRPYTIQVVVTSGHFSGGIGITAFIARHSFDKYVRNVQFNVTLEHMGWHYDDRHGEQVDSGLVCPGRLCLGNTNYLSMVSTAVQQNSLDRTFINPPQVSTQFGEGWSWQLFAGEPTIWWFVPLEYLATTADTMDKYCPQQMRNVLNTFAQIIDQIQGIH